MQYTEDEQQWINSMAAEMPDAQGNTPYYLRAKGEKTEGAALDFNAQFNPRLPMHSAYFQKLDALMLCVEKHVNGGGADNALVCKK